MNLSTGRQNKTGININIDFIPALMVTSQRKYTMINITEVLLKKRQELQEKAKALKAEKTAMKQEFTNSMDPETIKAQIAEADGIIKNAKIEKEKLLFNFKIAYKAIREKEKLAKEILDFVGYRIESALPRLKNSIVFDPADRNILIVKRGDIIVKTDITKPDWKKAITAGLESKGLSNGQARNIQYDAGLLLAARGSKV